MAKSGESSLYRGAVHLVFILFVVYVIAAFFVYPGYFEASVTGYAVYEEGEAQQKIEAAFSTASFLNSVPNANFCIQIKDEGAEHVFKVDKTPMGVNVVPSSDYCDGVSGEDLIVKFNDYDAFSAIMDDFTIQNIMSGKAGDKYYILESRAVQRGGDVNCDAAFKAKFCNAVSQFGSAEELITGDVYCCLDTMTRNQQRLLSDHLASSGFQNEMATIEKPSSVPGSLNMIIFAAVLGTLLLLGVGVMVVRKKPKMKPAKPAVKSVEKPAVVAPVQAQVSIDPRVQQLRTYVDNAVKA
ncbi:MAG: hypothetical protein ACE5DM_02905, partial [Candidatus Nanoarchaeia archaeon]